jgi:hypothetical protein
VICFFVLKQQASPFEVLTQQLAELLLLLSCYVCCMGGAELDAQRGFAGLL